jgi:hypothetical protein
MSPRMSDQWRRKGGVRANHVTLSAVPLEAVAMRHESEPRYSVVSSEAVAAMRESEPSPAVPESFGFLSGSCRKA